MGSVAVGEAPSPLPSGPVGDGTVKMGTKIKDVGTLRLDGGKTKIDNANRQGMGVLKFKDAIAYSRNVVAAKVAIKLGRTTDEAARKLFSTWTRLGFGAKTGLDVANEAIGRASCRERVCWIV